MTGSSQPWSRPWKQVLLGRTAISQRMRREREGTPLAGFTYSYFFCGCAWVKEPCCNLVSLWYRPILRFGDSHDFYQQKKIGQLTTKGQANNDSFVSGHSWDSKPFTGFNRTSETWLCRGTGENPMTSFRTHKDSQGDYRAYKRHGGLGATLSNVNSPTAS